MKKISSFKKFYESNSLPELTKDEIEEIFIDLIDEGYLFQYYNKLKGYYFDFRKQYIRQFDFNLDSNKYGCQDLNSMSKEIQKVLEILNSAKQRLNSMGFDIGFEPEFNFSEDSLFCITCHMAHHSIQDEDYD